MFSAKVNFELLCITYQNKISWYVARKDISAWNLKYNRVELNVETERKNVNNKNKVKRIKHLDEMKLIFEKYQL